MPENVAINSTAAKIIRQLPGNKQAQLRKVIQALSTNPLMGARNSQISSDLWMADFDNYRVTYRVKGDTLLIVSVALKQTGDPRG